VVIAFADSLRHEVKSQLRSREVHEFDRDKLLNLGHGEIASFLPNAHLIHRNRLPSTSYIGPR
jgi:hypothetical protein